MSSKVEWTDGGEMWNPIYGCTPVSPGCANCYAARDAARFADHKTFAGLAENTPNGGARWTGKITLRPDKLEQPLRWKRPRKIFVCGMSDLFHPDVPDDFIDQVFAVMALCPQHIFQVLTKRPERMLKYMMSSPNPREVEGRGESVRIDYEEMSGIEHWRLGGLSGTYTWIWPLPNVWLGTSCENQATADERIPLLLQTPAAVRWISAEPLLGQIDLSSFILHPSSLDWIVCGGESGPNARPMEEAWARDLMNQCQAAGVPFYMKQGSAANWPMFKDFNSFPADLRVREYPNIQEMELPNA